MLWNVDVWSEMDRLRREMNSLFSGYPGSTGAATYPLVNVYDGKENIVVTAELPGMTRDKVGITFSDGTLTLAGTLAPLVSGKNMAVVRQERATGSFEKTVRIPTKIKDDKISASFRDGILTVTLPKADEVKPKTIQIETK